MWQTLVILLLLSIGDHDTAKIFAWFPTPSLSHQVVFRPLTQELAKRGHKVTVVTTDPAFPPGNSPENLTEIDVHDMSYKFVRFPSRNEEIEDEDTNSILSKSLKNILKAFEAQLQIKKIQDLANGREKYDLLLLESCSETSLAVTQGTNTPIILISSFGGFSHQLESFGAPFHPFLYPSPMIMEGKYNLSTWEKVQEVYRLWETNIVLSKMASVGAKILEKHLNKDLRSDLELDKVLENVDLILLNEHQMWSDNQPVPPGVVHIGGIHKSPRKELPQDLQSFCDSSKHGVIYMSFGTNVLTSIFSPDKLKAFIKVFSELPYDVLWKWDGDELPERPPNVRISKWFPQSDLLHHPKVKLFITQGGRQSIDETMEAGVPVIGIPLFWDQGYNIERCVKHQVGLRLYIDDIDETNLKSTIEIVIGNLSYRENMAKLRDLMNDKPIPPLELAVWWTEYVLRHSGAKHLYSPSAHMSWTEYYELKLVLVLLGVSIMILAMLVMLLSCLVKLLKRFIKPPKDKQL